MTNPQWVLRITPELDFKAAFAAKKLSIGKSEFIKFAVSRYVMEILTDEELEEIAEIMDSVEEE